MAEYISKNEAINAVKSLESSMPAKDNYAKGYDAALGRALIAVREVPTADVQPIRRGRWMTSHPVDIAKEFKCTACGGLVELPVFAKKCYYDFCPNCGARMDGEYDE